MSIPEQPETARGILRQRRVRDALTTGVASKAITLLVNALVLPLTVRYLGAEQYGIWTTISTTMLMLAVLDLGIANTLTNRIAEAYAAESRELAGRYATTAFWAMTVLALLLGIAGWFAWPHIQWGFFFHTSSGISQTIARAMAAAFAIFLLGLPAGLASRLLGGYQEQRAANLFTALGSVLSLIAVLAVIACHGGLVALVFGYAGAMTGANVLCLLWLWLWHKPWLAPLPQRLDGALVGNILQTGGLFFVLQISSLIVFNSDNLVIAHFRNAAAVTPYSVTWRIVTLALAFQMLIQPALWPAYTEAHARGDMPWVRATYSRMMRVTVAITVVFCAVFLFAGQTIIRWWAGAAAVPPQSLIVAMCVWVTISTVMNNQACLLVALNEIRLQAWVSLAAAALNLALTIWLIQRIGVIGVIVGTIVSYLLLIVGPQTWKVRQVLRRNRLQVG